MPTAPMNSCQALVEDSKRGFEGLREPVDTMLSASLLDEDTECLLESIDKSIISRSSSFLLRRVDGESTVLRRLSLNGAAAVDWWCGPRNSAPVSSSSSAAGTPAVPLGLFFTWSHTLRDIVTAGELGGANLVDNENTEASFRQHPC